MLKEVEHIDFVINEEDTARVYSARPAWRNIFPKPASLARVDLRGAWGSATDAISVKMELEFRSDGGCFSGFANVKWQGSSSLAYPCKNLRLDLMDESGISMPVRFGEWVDTDSFDVKVNWIDFSQAKNVALANIAYAIDMDYPIEKRFPWWPKQIPNPGVLGPEIPLADIMESGARAIIDGFPVEVYINDEFYSIGTWNLKKDRKNMAMKKSNDRQIWMEMAGATDFTKVIDWSKWEFRNPDGIPAGAAPPDGTVKSAVQALMDWINDTSDFRNEAPEHLYVDYMIDYVILLDIWQAVDNVSKNMQLCSWDTQHWVLRWYDMDLNLGARLLSPAFSAPSSAVYNNILTTKIRNAFSGALQDRYAYLRNKGLIGVEAHEREMRKITGKFTFQDYERQLARWPELKTGVVADGYTATNTWAVSVNQMLDWLQRQLVFMDQRYGYS